jgi:hypothetical protein
LTLKELQAFFAHLVAHHREILAVTQKSFEFEERSGIAAYVSQNLIGIKTGGDHYWRL